MNKVIEKAYEFERLFMQRVEKIRAELEKIHGAQMSKKAICEQIYPDRAKPDNVWQGFLKPQKKGRPTSIKLEDAYKMASAIHYDLNDLIWHVLKEMSHEDWDCGILDNSKKKVSG